MRIGFNGAFWGQDITGSGQYTRQLMRMMARIAPDEEYILFVPPAAQVSLDDGALWTVYPLATPFDGRQANLAKLCFEQVTYPRACRRTGVEIAHVPYFAPPRYPTVPTVVTIHDLIPLILPEYRGSRLVRAYMRLVSAAAHHARLVLTDSQASARDIQRILHIPPERIRVIPLAVGERYRPLSPTEYRPVLDRLGVPLRYVLYLGGFDRRKNVNGLLHAWAKARHELAGVTLVIAGQLPATDSSFAPDPRVEARRLGLGDEVYYTGWVAEEAKPALYAGAAALAFPSYYEGFGLPVLEAISCGTPAIIGGGSSLEEIAGAGGLAVPPDDTDALADALVRLAHDVALREELAAQGLRRAQGFSWRETAMQTLQAYRDALAGAPRER